MTKIHKIHNPPIGDMLVGFAEAAPHHREPKPHPSGTLAMVSTKVAFVSITHLGAIV